LQIFFCSIVPRKLVRWRTSHSRRSYQIHEPNLQNPTYTGLCGGLEHPKIGTRLRGERFESVKGECVSSIFKLIRKTAALGRTCPTLDLSLRRMPVDGNGTGCSNSGSCTPETPKKNGQFPDVSVNVKERIRRTEGFLFFKMKR
jgi:hypothetical protein